MPNNISNIEYLETNTLTAYQNNPKLHPQKQVAQIASSIKQFGFINPIIIDQKKEIIAGHGRFEAAKLLKLERVPAILVDHLSKEEVQAYRLADNQLTLNSGYDDELLKIELFDLSKIDLDFDLEITGFETAEIDIILDESTSDNPEDIIPELPIGPTITKVGDIWILGNHRLICGDALQEKTYKQVLETTVAHIAFLDPPYNVPIDGFVGGKGKIKHREFAMATGEMSPKEFKIFLEGFISQLIKFTEDGSLHYICMDWRHIDALIQVGKEFYSELKNICVWNKDNGGMGSLYRSKHELVAVFKNGTKPHVNNIELGKHGRYRTNVWDYKGVNSFGRNQSDLKMHPTVKPVALVADAIKDCSKRGNIVLDPFAGSGSTLIAAEKTGRIARCIELDPAYCDVIVRRWQALTGGEAVHATTGVKFNNIQANGGVQ